MWNKLKRPLQSVLLLALVGLCVWAIVPIQKKIHLGLDLQGGARVMLQLEPTKDVPNITADVQNQVELVIDKRVNGLGVSEPVISKVGGNRLLVEVPAVKDATQLEDVLKQVAVLEFKILPPKVSACRCRLPACCTTDFFGSSPRGVTGLIGPPSAGSRRKMPTLYMHE